KESLKDISPGATNLIVLPEMFNTGFSMNATLLAEQMGQKSMLFLAEIAAEKNCDVTGSLIIDEGGKYFNRLIWMRPDGTYEYYNKRHLFRMGNEDKVYSAGTEKIIMDLNGWRILPLICYDLRFPVWSRNRNDYDILIYVANWPERRSYAWKQLLIARAIENLCYVVGVNRVGEDGNGISHSGNSMLLDFKGESIAGAKEAIPTVITKALKYDDLLQFKTAFPVYMDADNFTLETE
ncbi:MAG: amidohydrolase, partial [Bacteroidia bacterium]